MSLGGNYRNKRLIVACRSAPCMIRTPTCIVTPTAGCHSNLQRHGRGAFYKSHDCFTVPGCVPCHHWLDAGGAPGPEQEEAFVLAFERWVLWQWRNGLIRLVGA